MLTNNRTAAVVLLTPLDAGGIEPSSTFTPLPHPIRCQHAVLPHELASGMRAKSVSAFMLSGPLMFPVSLCWVSIIMALTLAGLQSKYILATGPCHGNTGLSEDSDSSLEDLIRRGT